MLRLLWRAEELLTCLQHRWGTTSEDAVKCYRVSWEHQSMELDPFLYVCGGYDNSVQDISKIASKIQDEALI